MYDYEEPGDNDVYTGPEVHEFDPDPQTGKCRGGWASGPFGMSWTTCGSTQRSSVLHLDPESDFRQMHDHGGGDCMCFENEPGGYYGAMQDYLKWRD